MSKIKKLMQTLGVSNEVLDLTKNVHAPKKFNSVKQNVPLIENYNLMADLLYLPEDSKTKYKYLLVVTDLANNNFDVAPLRDRDSKTVLDAMIKMFKNSHYIKKPMSSISVDSGSEFKDVFASWCKNNNIFLKVSMPARHSQQSNVESLNRVLGRVLNNYMNQQEFKSGKSYHDWVDALPIVVKELNDIRDKSLPKDIYEVKYSNFDPATTEVKTTEELNPKYIEINELFTGLTDGKEYEMQLPKFKVGDVVMRLLDKPKNILGHNENTDQFREGDVRYDFNQPRKITRILYMNNEPYYRYILNGFPNVSYSASELRKTKEKVEKHIINRISDRFKKNGQTYYKVHWKDAKNNKPSWEPRDELIKDIPDLVEAYDAKRR